VQLGTLLDLPTRDRGMIHSSVDSRAQGPDLGSEPESLHELYSGRKKLEQRRLSSRTK
jgi:hypothetical protein